ncbi:hypothetical protein PMAYCL1PPCAC_28096, partial [Pristionchus mayeri]
LSTSPEMIRPVLIFLVLARISSSTSTDHDLEAKKFFGTAANYFQQGRHGELFDLLYSKWEKFYPGLVSADQVREIRAAFVSFRENQETDKPFFSLAALLSVTNTIDAVEKEIKKRVFWHVNAEGKVFIQKVFASFPKEFSGQLRLLSGKFDAIRSDYEALGSPARKQLAKQFPIFAHLDEVKALVVVFDNLVDVVTSACENLSGFAECEHHLARVEKLHK